VCRGAGGIAPGTGQSLQGITAEGRSEDGGEPLRTERPPGAFSGLRLARGGQRRWTVSAGSSLRSLMETPQTWPSPSPRTYTSAPPAPTR